MKQSELIPRWWHNSVVYQIYPRSFNDANGDGVGDLRGIIDKLDHIQALGADVIWLSPVYKSPMDDNGYDISDYYDIDPQLGDMEDMDELIEQASLRRLKIVMDLVVNHTSDEHPWFQEAKSSKDNPKRDWYIWKDAKADGSEPNNWESFFSPQAWEWDDTTEQYYLHLFSKKQPDLNWANPELRQAVYKMMHFWLKKGIAGFRMDVINMIGKPCDYPDAAIFGQGVAGWEHWANSLLCHQYLREMHNEVLRHYDVLTVGETPFVTPNDGQFYSHPNRNELGMIFQFEHMSIDKDEHNARQKPFDLVEFKSIMSKWQDELHNKGWNSLYWNNHDQPRAVSRFGNDSSEYRVVSAKMLGSVLHMMSGTPYIYQGEELGMTNTHFETIDDFNDLMAKFHYNKMIERGVEPKSAITYLNKFSRDHARVPMQWDDSKNAGFTTGVPWLAVNPNYNEINAKHARNEKGSVFDHYQKLVELRRSSGYSDVIVYGEHRLLDAEDPHVYSYTRHYADQTILVVANFTDQTVSRSYEFTNVETLLSNYDDENAVRNLENLRLKPYQAVIFSIQSNAK